MKNKIYMAVPIPDDESGADISKIMLHKFYYDCMIPKWSENNVQFLYMDTDSLFPLTKTDDAYEDIRGDVEKWFDTSNTIKQEEKDHYLYEKTKK